MNKVKRIAAFIGLIFIVAMYLLTFLSSFFAGEYTKGLFLASLFSSIVLPIIFWWSMVIYRWMHKKDDSYPQEINLHGKSDSNQK